METLGRTMTPAFDTFYTKVEGELAGLQISYEAMQPGNRVLGRELGERIWGANIWWPGSRCPRVLLSLELPDEPYSHNAAHELAHILDRVRGFPSAMPPANLGWESSEGKAATNMNETIECVAIDESLLSQGIDPTWSRNRRLRFLSDDITRLLTQFFIRRDVRNPFFVQLVLRYVRTDLELSESEWQDVRTTMRDNWPEVTSLGDGLIEKLQVTGRTTWRERRASFRRLQLDLKLRNNVIIARPAEGS